MCLFEIVYLKFLCKVVSAGFETMVLFQKYSLSFYFSSCFSSSTSSSFDYYY